MSKLRRLAALSMSVAACAVFAVPSANAAPAAQKAKATWKISWRQEFTGTGKPSAKYWTQANGNGIRGWGTGGMQYYDPKNVALNGKGQLLLTARKQANGQECHYGPCQYTSGRIQTKGLFSHGYGRFVARMKLPSDQGMFPAFWMQTIDPAKEKYAEIDIVEAIGKQPRKVQGFAHAADGPKAQVFKNLSKPLGAGFHTYGVEWTPRGVTWWLDGKVYGRMKAYPGWTFNKPMFLILNLAVGGDWPGKPSAKTRFPAHMVIDYVRIYKKVA